MFSFFSEIEYVLIIFVHISELHVRELSLALKLLMIRILKRHTFHIAQPQVCLSRPDAH